MTQRRVSAMKCARAAEEASSRTRRSASASATYQTSSLVGPAAQRDIGASPAAARAGCRSPRSSSPAPPQIFGQNVLQFREPDAASPQLLAISIFRHVRLAAEDRRPALDCIVKRQVLECVQRVVMDEDRDRSLRGQQVRCVFDDFVEMSKSGIVSRHALGGRAAAGSDVVHCSPEPLPGNERRYDPARLDGNGAEKTGQATGSESRASDSAGRRSTTG